MNPQRLIIMNVPFYHNIIIPMYVITTKTSKTFYFGYSILIFNCRTCRSVCYRFVSTLITKQLTSPLGILGSSIVMK